MRTLVVLWLAGAAVAQAPSFQPKPIGNLKEVMRGILLPNSDSIFKVADKAPADDKDRPTSNSAPWYLGEAASLIAMPGRLRENSQPVPVRNADWAKYSAGLVDAAKACYQAAQAKSQDRVSECTDGLTGACCNCHKVYRDKPQK